MAGSYEKIRDYLSYLHDRHNVQICIKDFCGFIPINKALDEAVRPFLAHTNVFCMYMKSTQEHYRVCLSMIRRMYNKCKTARKTFFGLCHAGLGEYVVPIYSGDVLIGCINAGFFQVDERRVQARICRACRHAPALDCQEALALYREGVQTADVDVDSMLIGLELLAEYLGQTYTILQTTHSAPAAVRSYLTSSEDTILSHAMEYIRLNSGGHISVAALAGFCHCSESYLSRIFKRRTGVNINVYVNKVRMELAKNHLLLSNESVAEIASRVGFNDPNYFSRVFTQIIGVSPTEFRRRFQQELPPGQEAQKGKAGAQVLQGP